MSVLGKPGTPLVVMQTEFVNEELSVLPMNDKEVCQSKRSVVNTPCSCHPLPDGWAVPEAALFITVHKGGF